MTDLLSVAQRAEVELQKPALDVSLQRRNAPTSGPVKDAENAERYVTRTLMTAPHPLQARFYNLRMSLEVHQIRQAYRKLMGRTGATQGTQC